jgi:hypothetical protein
LNIGLVLVIILGLLIWVGLAGTLAEMAKREGMSFGLIFALSILGSPLLALMVLAIHNAVQTALDNNRD